jgi:hypothetical protein
MSRESNFDASGCATGGCGGCGCVLTLGLALSLFGAAIGGACSVRVPLTESNFSFAGAVGHKEVTTEALPNYLQQKVASNYDFINGTQSLTIGPAEGISITVLGEQPGSPAIDLHLDITKRRPQPTQ